MISDNFKKAILLYAYYMGYIETWPTLYNRLDGNQKKPLGNKEKKGKIVWLVMSFLEWYYTF